MKTVEVKYELDEALNKAVLNAVVEGNALKGSDYLWTIKSPAGEVVSSLKGTFTSDNPTISRSLQNIQLWWPNGYGKQNLYSSNITITKNGIAADTKESKVGFRTIKLVMSKGSWDEPQLFPKSRSVSPATFEVNGKVIFAKGSNWVHPEIFMGLATKATYEKQIKLAQEANMNIFRVWGGGVTSKESFFDLCD